MDKIKDSKSGMGDDGYLWHEPIYLDAPYSLQMHDQLFWIIWVDRARNLGRAVA